MLTREDKKNVELIKKIIKFLKNMFTKNSQRELKENIEDQNIIEPNITISMLTQQEKICRVDKDHERKEDNINVNQEQKLEKKLR